MKSRRRHELKENVLAHELGQVKQFLGKYGNWIFGGVAAVAIALLVVRYYVSRGQTQYTQDKTRYDRLLHDPEVPESERLTGLRDLAETASDAALAADAGVWGGDFCAKLHLEALIKSSPADAEKHRSRAAEFYELVISRYADEELAAAKAHLGLGVLAETAGDFALAKEHYEQVVRRVGPGFPVRQEAERRQRLLPGWSKPVRFARWPTPATAPVGALPTRPSTPTRPAPTPATGAAATAPE